MIKCPKCESKLELLGSLGSSAYHCPNDDCEVFWVSIRDLERHKKMSCLPLPLTRQQRLDNVLSKMKEVSRGYVKGLGVGEVSLFYNKEYKTFSLNHELNIISLEAAEIVIRDLEMK